MTAALVDEQGVTIPPKLTKIAIAIPSGDLVPAGFAFDLCQLVGATIAARPDLEIKLSNIQGTILQESRNGLVDMALKNECDYLLFIDSDMRFPRTALSRLLHHRLPVVAVNYCTRRSPSIPVTFKDDTHTLESRVYSEIGNMELEEVSATGLGLVLFDLDIFRALKRPWFAFAHNNEGQMIGEDIFLFKRIREELGIKVFVDHGLSQQSGHVGTYIYTMADALAARELKQARVTTEE